MHKCPRCGVAKPEADYPAGGVNRFARCSRCKADEMQAYKAGIRKDRCAVCAGPISGLGICSRCMDAIRVLGGSPDALKGAAKALKWVQAE